MPKKANNRKAIQSEKRKAAEVKLARQNRKWPGTRRVTTIAHHGASTSVLISLLAHSILSGKATK